MDRNFERALSLVLKHEGGWSDHPQDKGGATMKGVTLANFQKYVKPNASKADLRAITDDQIRMVYRRFYWDAVAGAELPGGIDYAVFDFAVNSGPSRAIKFLQTIVGAKPDGVIGPLTLKAVRTMDAATVINRLCDNRLAFVQGLSNWPSFGKGWTSRIGGVRSAALAMAAQPAEQAKPTIIERPVVADPGELETPPAKSKTVWTWALAGIGSVASAVGSVFGGLDWRVQFLITILTAGFAIYGIKRRNDLFKAVQRLHREFG